MKQKWIQGLKCGPTVTYREAGFWVWKFIYKNNNSWKKCPSIKAAILEDYLQQIDKMLPVDNQLSEVQYLGILKI